jgi:hypothetical protein
VSESQVFISYSNKKNKSTEDDRHVADMLYNTLKSQGINCFIAHKEIIPGEDWLDRLYDAIEQSKVMVLVVSSNTHESKYVKDEILFARDKEIKIIPFCIEKVPVEGFLRMLKVRCQWIDAYTQPLEKHVDRLVEAVLFHLGKESKSVDTDDKERKFSYKKWLWGAAPLIILFGVFFVLNHRWCLNGRSDNGSCIKIFCDYFKQVEEVLIKKLGGKRQRENKKGERPIDPKTIKQTGEPIKREKGKELEPYDKGDMEKGKELKNQKWKDEKKVSDIIVEKEVKENGKDWREACYEDGIIMVYIPPSNFTMGSNEINDGKPLHEVHLDGYWIGKYEVTFDQYDRFCEETKREKPSDEGWGRGKRPVINVSWDDANDYCEWLSRKTGLKFKLPSEAQWEKAARGSDGRKYPWGNHDPYYQSKWYANYQARDDREKRHEDGFKNTAPVGSFPAGASPYGLLDMAGNVAECCSEKSTDQTGSMKGSSIVVRGGHWNSTLKFIRCAAHLDDIKPGKRYNFLGFRLCQDCQ